MNTFYNDCIKVAFLISELNKKKEKASFVNKTKIQKLCFLLNVKGILHFRYSMYLHGPESDDVSTALSVLSGSGIIQIDWQTDLGYHIVADDSMVSQHQTDIEQTEKNIITQLAERYGQYDVHDLIIITSSIYLKEYFQVKSDDIETTMKKINPDLDHAKWKYIEQASLALI